MAAGLAGSIPKGLSNYIAKQFLYEKLTNLRESANSSRYSEIGRHSPDRDLCLGILGDPGRLEEVVRARLSEFIEDCQFIDWMSQEVPLYDLITADQGEISERLLHSWGSEQAKNEAVRLVLRQFLEMKQCGPSTASHLIQDDALIQAIRCGEKDAGASPVQVIRRRLETPA